MVLKKSLLIGMSCVMASLVSVSASAALIDGTLELAGGWTPIDSNSISTTLGAATGIDFAGDQSVVVASSGDLAMPFATVATMTDFQFNPLTPNPVTVWSVGVFSFSMDSVTIVTQNATDLIFSGTGTITGGGLEPTPGAWEFSGQTASGVTFSWSASNSTVVPVPAAVWLFGSGLIGLVGVARRPA